MEKETRLAVCEPLLAGNELAYVSDAVSTGWISSSGKYVKEFEEAFAAYCGVQYAVAVCNGTVALHLALVALGIGEGDEVIIPDFTMIASAFAVCYTGAKPVFVDADPETWNIDARRIEEKVTSRTKAIMPVHIFGLPCDMKQIREISERYGLLVIEDAAEAHGAEYEGKRAGSLSSIAAFSFFSNKNITTGEGGMVVTDRKELYDKARYHKNMCFPLDGPRNYQHEAIGFNYRMSNIHAAIGLAQVEKADIYRAMRIRNGKLYRELLAPIEGIRFQAEGSASGCTSLHVHWMNGICVVPERYGHSRDELMQHLAEKRIETRLFFSGMHRQKALIDYGCSTEGAYPVTDALSKNGFYLPSASSLSESDISYVCDTIKNFRK